MLHLIFRSFSVNAQTGCFVRARLHLVFPQLDTSNASPLHFGFASAQPKTSLCPCPLCLKTQQLCHKSC